MTLRTYVKYFPRELSKDQLTQKLQPLIQNSASVRTSLFQGVLEQYVPSLELVNRNLPFGLAETGLCFQPSVPRWEEASRPLCRLHNWKRRARTVGVPVQLIPASEESRQQTEATAEKGFEAPSYFVSS